MVVNFSYERKRENFSDEGTHGQLKVDLILKISTTYQAFSLKLFQL